MSMLCNGRARTAIAVRLMVLRVAVVASAATAALATGGGFATSEPNALVRRENENQASQAPDVGASFVDIVNHALAMGRRSMVTDSGGGDATAPPICGDDVVADTCRLLRRGDDKTQPLLSVTFSQLNDALGFCTSLAQVEALMTALKLTGDLVKSPTSTKREDTRVGCPELCDAALAYFNGKGAASGIKNPFVVPPSSDKTCYRDKAGSLSCSLSVDPDTVSTELGTNKYFGGEKDENAPRTGSGGNTNEGVATKAYTESNCPFEGDKTVLRVAQLFRFYPRRVDNDAVDTPSTVSASDQTHIFQSLARAEAWLSLTLRAMVNFQTKVEDEKYFGGPGPLDKKEVRTIVWRVLSYALVVFMEGVHVKSPGRHCGGLVLAYVLAASRGEDAGIAPNVFGCGSDGECGRGPDHRYHVHLCNSAYKQPPADFVSIFVHEVVHHAGPVDVSYDVRKLKKKLTQAQQLDNAATYQRFFLEVITDEKEFGRRFKNFWTGLVSKFRESRNKRKEKRKAKRNSKKTVTTTGKAKAGKAAMAKKAGNSTKANKKAQHR